MRAMLGEEGTEQFTVETRVDGQTVKIQPIHDPFIHSTAIVTIGRWGHFLAIFKRRPIKVEITVRGSEGAQRAIMMMDPEQLTRDTEEILEQRRISREGSPMTIGYYYVGEKA